MSDDAKPDLSFATTEELLAEIDTRFDAVVMVAESDRSETDRRWHRHFHGGYSRVIGMMVRAYRYLLREEKDSYQEE